MTHRLDGTPLSPGYLAQGTWWVIKKLFVIRD